MKSLALALQYPHVPHLALDEKIKHGIQPRGSHVHRCTIWKNETNSITKMKLKSKKFNKNVNPLQLAPCVPSPNEHLSSAEIWASL